MTMPNPLVPEGSQLEQKSKARSRVKLAVFFVLSIHVVGLMALLVQGCRPEEQTVPEEIAAPQIPDFQPVAIPTYDTNPVLQPPVTNLPPDARESQPVFTDVPSTQPIPYQPQPEVMPEPQGLTYTIQKGDTYYSIGQQFGVSMQALKDANPGVEPTRLQLGQIINIPAPTPERLSATAPTSLGENIYTVVSGDTLSKIAQKHGTTWQELMAYNNLETTSIKVGDKLKIPPAKPTNGGAPGSF